MRNRRIITLILAGALAGASAVPALAQSEDKPTGLELARRAAAQAVELAADGADAALPVVSPTVPPGQDKDKPGRGPADNGNANKGNVDKGDADKGNADKGNPHDEDVEKVTGRARAAAAIATALAKGNGNGFGRSHAREVIELLLDDKTPAALETDENHGAKVSAMVKAFNELKAQERAAG